MGNDLVQTIQGAQKEVVEMSVRFDKQRDRPTVEADVQQFAVVPAHWVAPIGWNEVEFNGEGHWVNLKNLDGPALAPTSFEKSRVAQPFGFTRLVLVAIGTPLVLYATPRTVPPIWVMRTSISSCQTEPSDVQDWSVVVVNAPLRLRLLGQGSELVDQ